MSDEIPPAIRAATENTTAITPIGLMMTLDPSNITGSGITPPGKIPTYFNTLQFYVPVEHTVDAMLALHWPVRPCRAGFVRLEFCNAGNPECLWRASWRFDGYHLGENNPIKGTACAMDHDGAAAEGSTAVVALKRVWMKMLKQMAALEEKGCLPESWIGTAKCLEETKFNV